MLTKIVFIIYFTKQKGAFYLKSDTLLSTRLCHVSRCQVWSWELPHGGNNDHRTGVCSPACLTQAH
jgi:hypothetical protein